VVLQKGGTGGTWPLLQSCHRGCRCRIATVYVAGKINSQGKEDRR